MNRICAKCKENKPATIEFFYKNKKGMFGLSSYCKKCTKEYHKAYCSTDEFKQKNKEYSANWRKENHERSIEISRENWRRNGHKYNERKSRLKLQYPEFKEKILNSCAKSIRLLKPHYVASLLGVSVNDLNPDLYETKKLILSLKREIGITKIKRK